jgi:hypothetical protein
MRLPPFPQLLRTALCIAGLFACADARAQTPTAHYVGTDGNWFLSSNWSTGAVPDAATDVLIDGDSQVVIDPALGSAVVQIRDLTLRNAARLTTRPGTKISTRNELLDGGGFLQYESTESAGDTFAQSPDPAGCITNCGGIKFNPTAKSKRVVILQSSFTATFGLGGALAAAQGAVGAGRYATLTGEDVTLAGLLGVELFYGFTPSPGDSFQIISALNSLSGQFEGLPEGAMAARFGDTGLFITYQGGDGNDVRLNAVAVPEPGLMALSSGAGALFLLIRRRKR